jgi:uncharacterized protein (TIGR02118 family)
MTIRLVYCLRRLSSLSQAEFLDYWLNVHGPLVRGHASMLHIRRYEQAHSLSADLAEPLTAVRNSPEPFDGVASLWFDSADDMRAAASTPEGRNAAIELLRDERTFIDTAQSPLWFAEDHRLV